MPSQVGQPRMARCVCRRGFLRECATWAGAAAGLTTVGCVPTGQGPLPQKVWGRRGFSPGRFQTPRAITIDRSDLLYIVDKTARIQVFDVEGNLLRWWRTPQRANGKPTGLAIGKGNSNQTAENAPDPRRLLVADTHYYRMLCYTLDGRLQPDEQIGGVAGHVPGQFAFVTDAVCDDRGCFYIGEYGASDRIQKFDPFGNFLAQWGGNGHLPGNFFRPQSLVIRNNVLWVADACNHRIQRFDIREEKPRLIDIWGGPGTANGKFHFPYDLAIASDQSVVVVEYKNNRIQRFDRDGKWIASWGGPGFDPGRLNGPWGLVIDSSDQIHLLDTGNHRVQRLGLPA